MWNLDLPDGMSVMNTPYGMLFMSGSLIIALIHIKVNRPGGGGTGGTVAGKLSSMELQQQQQPATCNLQPVWMPP